MATYQVDAKLPFPTRYITIDGDTEIEYDVPDEEKAQVLKDLFPFASVPALTDRKLDIHSGKEFTVSEFRVVFDPTMGINFLVSPYYEEGKGTVIDWVTPESKCAEKVGQD